MDESSIFSAAIERSDPRERRAFVAGACQGDLELQARVEGLLWAHENPESFLDNPLARDSAGKQMEDTVSPAPHTDSPGSRVGLYKLLQQIGEGGMGVVYMAEQHEPVRRRVALKIIKPGMDSRPVIARFEAERQALAMMEHPNIAKVLDAGTTTNGLPYFVMELVQGIPLLQYCDDKHLRLRERLRLFIAVCQAIQHAHQKGVIHRDLKPGNILVAEYDDLATPKVIDFGVAKATSQQLTAQTLFTHFGQIVGTLEYMSPEQAKQNQLDVDTRTDIYSLGVVLFELLTGDRPFDRRRFEEAAFDEMLRMIREEQPPRPSVKYSSSETRASAAACRDTEPQKLSALMRGDLDWIVMKALEKDRNRRYSTASEFAADLERHLAEQPILARPPSIRYRLRKFARRNPGALTTAASLLLLMVTLLSWYSIGRYNNRNRQIAQTNRLSSAIEQASLTLGLAMASPVGEAAPWLAAEASRARVVDALAAGAVDQDVKQRADAFIREFDRALEDRELAQKIEQVVILGASHSDLDSWLRMERNFHALFLARGMDLDHDPPDQVARRIREDDSQVLLADALELWIGTRGQMAALGGPRLNRQIMQPWAEAMYVADSDPVRTGIRRLIYAGRPPRAEEVEALVHNVSLRKLSPRTLSWLATVYGMAGQLERSGRIFELGLDEYAGDFMLNFDYAYALSRQERWEEAIRYFMRCIAIRSDVAGVHRGLGNAYVRHHEPQRGIAALEKAGDIDPLHGPTFVDLAEALLELGQFDRAREAAQRAAELMTAKAAPPGIIGRTWMEQGKYELALPLLAKSASLAKNDRTWKGPIQQWLSECRARLKSPTDND